MINKITYVLFLAGICATTSSAPRPPDANLPTEVQIFIGGLTAFVKNGDGSVTALLVDARKPRKIKHNWQDTASPVEIPVHHPVAVFYNGDDSIPFRIVSLVGQELKVEVVASDHDTLDGFDAATEYAVDMKTLYSGFQFNSESGKVIARLTLAKGKVEAVQAGTIGFKNLKGVKKTDRQGKEVTKAVATVLSFKFKCEAAKFKPTHGAEIQYEKGKVVVFVTNAPEHHATGLHSDFMFDLGKGKAAKDSRFYPYTISKLKWGNYWPTWVPEPDCPVLSVSY